MINQPQTPNLKPQTSNDVIIIGSGLGGLTCGALLAKHGYRVTILEQGAQVGGCLQCFIRRGVRFETGMHFIGSALPHQTLGKVFEQLEIADKIQLSPLDADGYDVISIDDKEYRFASGRDGFIQSLAAQFPHQRQNLERYFDIIDEVARASSFASRTQGTQDDTTFAINTEFQTRSVNDVIDSVITDPLLARVLVGNLPLYAGVRNQTPFATHAFITNFYNQSAFRIVGGSDNIARALVDTVERYGGRVMTHQRVTRITCNDTQATGVEVEGGVRYDADYIISDAHPVRTLQLIDSHLIRPAARARINAIPQTAACFAVYMAFKPDTMPYMNHNYYAYDYGTPWDCEQYDDLTWPKGYLYMHFCDEPNQQYARAGVVLSYMSMSEVARWRGTKVGMRGADYEALKHDRAERLLTALERHKPGLRHCIEHYYTSTPLTYEDYTGTVDGGMYGIAKDVSHTAAYRVSHRTRIPNLLQTGQNINSHGMLGVLVGTIVTCDELLK